MRGREFSVYLEYGEQLKESYPAYPDLEEQPEYTGEGRPFATAEQESCPHCKPNTSGKPPPGGCGGCGWLYREQMPYDPSASAYVTLGSVKTNRDRRKTK